MRQKINIAVARELLWDNASYLMSVVSTALNEKYSEVKQPDFDVDGIIIAMEWWLGQLLYLKHGRKHDAKLLLYEIMESAMIAYDRQSEVFKACEKKTSKVNNWRVHYEKGSKKESY